MSQNDEPITDQQLDAYLDGLLDESERQAFQRRLAAHPEITREIRLQQRIDASLRNQFPLASVPENQLLESAARSSPPPPRQTIASGHGRGRIAWRLAAVGATAAAVWVVAVWQWRTPRMEAPFFAPLPVAAVYRDVLQHGFEPYYECREEARFAATFFRRLGQPLRLASLPPGSQMLGLSYPGGLSRNTTAMLCRVDGQPVMVFVDRLSADLPPAARNDDPRLQVHRVVKAGLVFYEVTPFDTARVIDFLVPAS